MWRRPPFLARPSHYHSPSALHRNLGVWRRTMAARGIRAGAYPRMLAALDRAEERRFEVFYGYNPRCCQVNIAPLRRR